jgi:hypothetical protein
MLEKGVWAEVKIGNEHLRLFSEASPQGIQSSVFNVNTKTWIAPSESVSDLEEGKDKAALHAQQFLRQSGLELPAIEWKPARTV